MADKSAIEWTDATWNPIRGTAGRHVCQRVSPGCDNCYAATMTRRFGGPDYAMPGQPLNDEPRLDDRVLIEPLRWQRPRRVFVCSMTDLFGEWVPDEWILEIWLTMLMAKEHTFQVLTKRPKRMAEWLARIQQPIPGHKTFADELWPLANVWLGVSIELNSYAWRAKVLSEIPAAIRFVSAEPLLGPLPSLDLAGIDWLIVGGESGGPPERRLVEHCPCRGELYVSHHGHDYSHRAECPWACNATGWRPRPEWVRPLRDRANAAAGVAFFFKQWGGPTPKAGGRLLDGREWSEYPRIPEQACRR